LPSVLHELLIALFSHTGELARMAVASVHPQLTTARVVRSVSADLSQLVPMQHLADHVLAFYRTAPTNQLEEQRPDLVIILECQLDVDEHKNYAWPSYLANAAARFKCDACLLVITKDASVARWARGPFGPSQMPLRPAVFCLSEMPSQLAQDDALENPALAVLHALAHPGSATARIAFEAIDGFPKQLQALSFVAIMNALPDTCREILEDEMLDNSNWEKAMAETEYMQRYIDRRAERRAQEKVQLMEGEIQQRVEREIQQRLEAEIQQRLEAEIQQRLEAEVAQERERELAQERLSFAQGLALALMRSKLGQVSAAEEAELCRLDGASLAPLILDLGLAADAEQLRAALARASAR
jgi:hypothetical protein